jgi:ATP-dependent Zn protease
VKEILKNAYDTAIRLINENKKLHEKISKDLLEKEEISESEFKAYFA